MTFFYLMCGCLPCGRICSKCKPLLGYWKIDYKRIEKKFPQKEKKKTLMKAIFRISPNVHTNANI